MAVDYSVNATHAVAYPGKVLAAEGGAHIYNVMLTDDCDNGAFINRGQWLDLDLYEEIAATEFEGIVRMKLNNGLFVVEVTNPGDALFVQMPVVPEEEWTHRFLSDHAWYNAANTVARCYELKIGDILEISKEGFTAEPVLVDGEDYVVELSGKKLAAKETDGE